MNTQSLGTDNVPQVKDIIYREPKKQTEKNNKKLLCKLGIAALILLLSSFGITKAAIAKDRLETSEEKGQPMVQTSASESEKLADQEKTYLTDDDTKDNSYTIAKQAEDEVVNETMRLIASTKAGASQTPKKRSESLPSSTEVLCEQEEREIDEGILSGNEFVDKLSKLSLEEQKETTISGLLWNNELMADIRKRIESGEFDENAKKDTLDEEEIIVSMGMEKENTNDPQLPSYLDKTFNPQMVVTLTTEELATLMKLVEAEAPDEDIYGKILVANVVMNRVASKDMANTVLGVIYEKIGGSAQFSPTVISWYWNSIVVTDSTREAVARCLNGEDYSDGALYFYAWEKNPNKQQESPWMRELTCLFTHGGHRFFR